MVETVFRSRRPDGAPRCAGLSTPWLSPAPPCPGSMSATGSTGRTSPASGQTEKTRPRRDSAALRPLAMMQTDGRLIEAFRLRATKTAGIFLFARVWLADAERDGREGDGQREGAQAN